VELVAAEVAVALVSPELVAAEVVVAQLVVVVEEEPEQALVVAAQVLPLSPALLQLQTTERHRARLRLCSLQLCRPL
jgi:hypothetical protein